MGTDPKTTTLNGTSQFPVEYFLYKEHNQCNWTHFRLPALGARRVSVSTIVESSSEKGLALDTAEMGKHSLLKHSLGVYIFCDIVITLLCHTGTGVREA